MREMDIQDPQQNAWPWVGGLETSIWDMFAQYNLQ